MGSERDTRMEMPDAALGWGRVQLTERRTCLDISHGNDGMPFYIHLVLCSDCGHQLNRRLEAHAAIPEHGSWPRYAPGFTIEIERGNMADDNTEDYVREIEERITGLAERIRAQGR